MYKIIGADQKEYGPVSLEQLRQWIAEGRVNGQTPLQAEGTTGWKPLSMFPEFADAIAASRLAPVPPPLGVNHTILPADILVRDYDLDIGHCIGRAWTLVFGNFWGVIVGVLAYWGIQLGLQALAQLPLLGLLVIGANFFIAGPLLAGVFFYLLKHVRGQPAEVGNIFAGFGPRFLHLMLVSIVQSVIGGILAVPGLVIAAFGFIPLISQHQQNPEPALIALIIVGVFVAIIPATLARVMWIFALPLVIDKHLDFWPAMETSRKVVFKHFFVILAFCIVVGIVSMLGMLACCIGVVVTATIGWVAMMYAYEDIFSQRQT